MLVTEGGRSSDVCSRTVQRTTEALSVARPHSASLLSWFVTTTSVRRRTTSEWSGKRASGLRGLDHRSAFFYLFCDRPKPEELCGCPKQREPASMPDRQIRSSCTSWRLTRDRESNSVELSLSSSVANRPPTKMLKARPLKLYLGSDPPRERPWAPVSTRHPFSMTCLQSELNSRSLIEVGCGGNQ